MWRLLRSAVRPAAKGGTRRKGVSEERKRSVASPGEHCKVILWDVRHSPTSDEVIAQLARKGATQVTLAEWVGSDYGQRVEVHFPSTGKEGSFLALECNG